MSLEQALLDRLEKRSLQVAQKENEINGLRQIRNEMQHRIAELQTERDRILEISKSLVPKSALKQAVMEAAGLSSEVAKLRAEVPLESTREALKNAVAKLQEVTTEHDRMQNELAAIYAEANKSGYCNGDPVAQIKKGQHDTDKVMSLSAQLQSATSRADNIATCRDRWMKIAADCGRMDGEDAGEFIARLAQQSTQGAYLAVKVEELRVANIKQEQELEELRAFAKADNKRHGDLRDEMTAACNLATSCGMRGDESLRQFVERICGKVVSLTTELQCANDEADDMRKRWIKLNDHARMKGMEGSEGVAEFITRLQHMAADRKTALDRAAETIAKMGTGEVVKHPVIDWQVVATNLQNEIARLNAQSGPLKKLYAQLNHHCRENTVRENADSIYHQVAAAKSEIDRLTA